MQATTLAGLPVLALTLGLATVAAPARADTSDAQCEYHKDGEKKKKASGDCTFSQRQGNVTIELKDGKTYHLTPQDKADHYKDDKGNKVVRKMKGDDQVYQWKDDDKKIVVSFGSRGHGGSGGVDDLEGMRASSGERELEDRGYRHRNTIKVGGSSIAYWWNPREKHCIAVTTKDGHYSSVANQPEKVCDDDGGDRHSGGSHAGGQGDTPHDLRDLVHGRYVGGEVDDQLVERGYKHVKNEVSGRDVWSNWKKHGSCVSVHFNDGRVQSIVSAPDFDCK